MSKGLTTTLNAIHAHRPCTEGWEALLASLGVTRANANPLPFEHILDNNGLTDALWALRALPPEDEWIARKYAVRCVRRVEQLMTDTRSIAALDVAERHARGEASDKELAAAWDAAWAAVWDAAWDAAWAARYAASVAARDAAWAAVWDAAGASVWGAASVAERAWQSEEYRRMCRREGAYESRTAED